MVALDMPEKSDRLVPKDKSTSIIMDLDQPRLKNRRVKFNLTIDIKPEPRDDDACVPQGPSSLSDFSDGESLSDQPIPIPTTPGGKPQV